MNDTTLNILICFSLCFIALAYLRSIYVSSGNGEILTDNDNYDFTTVDSIIFPAANVWGAFVDVAGRLLLVFLFFLTMIRIGDGDDKTILYLVLVGMVYFFLKLKIVNSYYRKFANENFLEYSDEGNIYDFEGPIYVLGHSRKFKNIVNLRIKGHDTKLFTYDYTTGVGDKESTAHLTILQVGFDFKLPALVLNPKRTGMFGSYALPTYGIMLPQEIYLDGPFYQTHRLIAGRMSRLEALQIFTPDFLEKLLGFTDVKLQLYGKKMIIVRYGIEDDPDKLRGMFKVAELFIAKIDSH
jgi:hypothetical protein